MLRIELNHTEIENLKRLERTASGQVSERSHFVPLSHQRDSTAKIAEWMFKAENTVKYWLRRYQTNGLKRLEDDPHPGRHSNMHFCSM